MTRTAVVIDSNLLLLYIVGCASREYIAKHKRLKTFDASDFDLLVGQLSAVAAVVLTPNTLTETSNLIDHIAEPARSHIYRTLRALLSLPEAMETYVPSSVAAEVAELPRLGLTDCALLDVCTQDVLLITVDLALYLAAVCRGAKALNFNHLREASA